MKFCLTQINLPTWWLCFLLFYVFVAGMTYVIPRVHHWQLALHWIVIIPLFMMT